MSSSRVISSEQRYIRNKRRLENPHYNELWKNRNPEKYNASQEKHRREYLDLIELNRWINITTIAGINLKRKFISCDYRKQFNCSNRDCIKCLNYSHAAKKLDEQKAVEAFLKKINS